MSSLRIKAIVAVFTIVTLVSSPYMVMAASNSWTPPTQAPIGGNVPAPINEGSFSQIKLGGLSLKGLFKSTYSSELSGDTIIQPDASNVGRVVNFLESFFYGDTHFGDGTPFNGSGNEIPVDVSIYGKFKYQTADNNGNPVTVNPGYVLAANDEGYTEWVDPATITGGGGTGTDARLPDGTAQGDTMYWDTATSKWKVASNVKINPNATTTFSASGQLGSLKVNNMGSTAIDGALRLTLTNSPNPTAGMVLKTIDNTGLTTWGDALPAGGNDGDILTWNSTTNQWESVSNTFGANLPTATAGQTLWYNGTTNQWQATSRIKHVQALFPPNTYDVVIGDQSLLGGVIVEDSSIALKSPQTSFNDGVDGVINIHGNSLITDSSNVRFEGDSQIVSFEGSAVKFNSSFFEPTEGAVMYSQDDQGAVKWSHALKNKIMNIFNLTLDVVKLEDDADPDRYPLLWNEGLTFLAGDTTIDGVTEVNNNLTVSENGDLWLEGIEQPNSSDSLKHLCVRMSDKKVVRCDAYTLPGSTPETVTRTTYVHETFGPGSGPSVTFPRPNQAPGIVTVKACSAGGGGGGGGRGYENGHDVGNGGGGGGGGGKGNCSTSTISAYAGGQLTWNIGTGGTGGSPGYIDTIDIIDLTFTDSAANSGQPGGGTTLAFNGNQLANLQGGQGGYAGQNASASGFGVGGSGGSSNLSIATASWHKGANGQPGLENATEMGSGGAGGMGEDNVSGQGGAGGSPGQPQNGYQFGEPGYQGAAGYGGGGGGGGAGKWDEYTYLVNGNPLPNYTATRNRGDWGGNGGNGYVDIGYYAYVQEVVLPTEAVWEEPGTHTFDPSILPAGTTSVTLEVWGAGGGGGKAISNQNTNIAGGGGAGAYAKLENFPITPTSSNVTVVVGAGGAVASQPTTTGGSGGQSKFGTVLSANGGLGGSQSAGGLGSSTTNGGSQNQDGGNGGLPAGGAGFQGSGNGGIGMTNGTFTDIQPQPGQNGRVRVSW